MQSGVIMNTESAAETAIDERTKTTFEEGKLMILTIQWQGEDCKRGQNTTNKDSKFLVKHF